MNKAILNVDLFFGDSSKGSTVEFQTKMFDSNKPKLNVRFNGGAQAKHTIILNDGRNHAFSQFGAATFQPNVHTFLSRFMLVNPLAMDLENDHLIRLNLHDAYNRMHIDGMAVITTPYHRAVNRLKELARGSKMHGSCGMGISATVEDLLTRPLHVLRMKDLLDINTLKDKLNATKIEMYRQVQNIKNLPMNTHVDMELSTFQDSVFQYTIDQFTKFARKVRVLDETQIYELFNSCELAVFEPAQGVLLDENYGFHPFTTWTTCTLTNARQILKDIGFTGDVDTYGVCRVFATRHGPGPFPTENNTLSRDLSDPNNTTNIWQHGFRCGWLDLVLLDYALRANGNVDHLSTAHFDYLSKYPTWKVCTQYKLDGIDWIPNLPATIGKPYDMHDQEELTNKIQRVEPVYIEVKPEEIKNLIETKLKAKIKILGNGPTFEDRRYIY